MFSDFKNSIVAREARVLLGLFAPITPSWKFKKIYPSHAKVRCVLPLTDDTHSELITAESLESKDIEVSNSGSEILGIIDEARGRRVKGRELNSGHARTRNKRYRVRIHPDAPVRAYVCVYEGAFGAASSRQGAIVATF